MKDSRGVILLVAIAVLVFGGAYWIGAPTSSGGPLDPNSHDKNGTSALVALLDELGADVSVDAEQPGPDTDVTLVMRDRLDDAGRERLLDWVSGGGILVVADPGSELTPVVTDQAIAQGVGGPVVEASVEIPAGTCDIAALDGIESIDVFAGASQYEVTQADESCFGNRRAAYVVATELGEGTIVALGGVGILQNRALGDLDNAPLIAALVAPREGTQVVVVDPLTAAGGGEGDVDGAGDDTLWDLMPDGMVQFLVQLGVAFVLYSLWRSRRVGRPVEEPQPVKVASAELVAAVGGLLERSRSPQHAAEVLRGELRSELAVRLGLARNVNPTKLAEILTDRTSLDPAQLQAAIGPGPVATDTDLLAVAQLIDVVRMEVFEHVGS